MGGSDKKYNFKVGKCYLFNYTDNVGYYYQFLIVSKIKRNDKTFWIGIKDNVFEKEPELL